MICAVVFSFAKGTFHSYYTSELAPGLAATIGIGGVALVKLIRANRAWLQTDKRNERSQNAIARLGAKREGELRNERVLPDGRVRTSVVFGITPPAVAISVSFDVLV